jgi:hypothetical protein
MFFFMNFALNEHPVAHCQPKQFKLILLKQQHNASEMRSLKFLVAKKSAPNVDKLTITVLLSMDPVNVSLSICTVRDSISSVRR